MGMVLRARPRTQEGREKQQGQHHEGEYRNGDRQGPGYQLGVVVLPLAPRPSPLVRSAFPAPERVYKEMEMQLHNRMRCFFVAPYWL
jgi:hypothetical protein